MRRTAPGTRSTVRTVPSLVATLLGALLMLHAAPAGAAPSGPVITVSGFGDQPGLAQIVAATLAPNGMTAITGSSDTAGMRRAVVAFGTADGIGPARGLGPRAGAFDVASAADASGHTALAFSVGHVAYLATCRRTTCRRAVPVGTSRVNPEPAVAVQPRTGRTLVLWRGHTRRGADRLQWRITKMQGMLGPTHTLGEFGDTPQVVTDATGRTVAVWLADPRSSRGGVRTAARRARQFGNPATITRSRAAALRLVTSARGRTVAAWLASPRGIDQMQPVGTLHVATQTPSTRFGTPVSLGQASTLSLAGSPDGHAVLAVDRHPTLASSSVVVAVSRRAPGGRFGPLADVSPPQFISDAFGATAAVADGGRALVAWASAPDPSAPGPAGVFVTLAGPSGPFMAPEQLADAQTATLPQPIGAAIGARDAVVAWVGPGGVRLARVQG